MRLIESIKEHESFVGTVYKDSVGKDTIGYGTKLPLTEKEAEMLLYHRLELEIKAISKYIEFIDDLNDDVKEILFEMSYQLGAFGVSKFKNMLKAIKIGDFNKAADEMIDSKWYKQTPNRVLELAGRMRRIKYEDK